MSEKTFKTYDELLTILQSRGIDLSTSNLRGQAKKAIQHSGYYNLINGYKEPFLQKDAQGLIILPERYIPGTRVNEIQALLLFDTKLRAIVLKNILAIETNIKALIAYTFSEAHGHKNYLIYDNFDTQKKDATSQIAMLFADIQRQISGRVSDPSIHHYLTKHGYIPIWVLNNILTLGTVSKFYSLMRQKERQSVSRIFGITDDALESILLYLSSVRNICAHSNRLYCYRTKRPLTDLDTHQKANIPRTTANEYAYGKRDLFAVMLIFKTLLPANDFTAAVNQISAEIKKLDKQLHVLTKDGLLKYMGFPMTWKKDL